MSLREKFDLGRQKLREAYGNNNDDIEQRQSEEALIAYAKKQRKELAHSAIFTEIVDLRDVCKYLLNGRPTLREPICDEDGTKYIISCISGTTTRIKIINENYIDDYCVDEINCRRKLTEYSENHQPHVQINFDVTSGNMNGFSEEELTNQLKALYDLEKNLLVATGYLTKEPIELESEYYAA